MPTGFTLSNDEAFAPGNQAPTLDLTQRHGRDDPSFSRRPNLTTLR
jgi:hypothetical protein